MLSSVRRVASRVGTPAAVALVVAAVAAPAGAAVAAAVTRVMVADSQGDAAQVTKANQLQVTEAPATAVRTFTHYGLFSCVAVAKAPKTQGLIVDQVTFDVYGNPTPGSGEYVALFTEATCSTNPIRVLNPGGIGPVVAEFPHGLGVAAGKKLYAAASGSVASDVYASGYLVSRKAVSPTISVTHLSKPLPGRYVQK